LITDSIDQSNNQTASSITDRSNKTVAYITTRGVVGRSRSEATNCTVRNVRERRSPNRGAGWGDSPRKRASKRGTPFFRY